MSENKYKSRSAEVGFGRRPRGGLVEKPKDGKDTLKRLLSFFAKEKNSVFLLILIVVIGTAASVAAPGFQSSAIDTITAGQYDDVFKWVGLMLAGYLTYGVSTLLQGYLSAHLSQKVIRRLRSELFVKIATLPVSYIDSHSHGDLMSRMTNDADNISNVIAESMTSLVSGILTLSGTVAVMLWYSVPLTLLTCSTILITILLTAFLTKKVRVFFSRRQILLGKLNGMIEEMIRDTHTVTAYSMQEKASADFCVTADDLTKAGIAAEIVSGSMGPLMSMLNNVSFVIVAVFGAWFALKGYISIGVISAFIIYSKQFSRPINEIAQLYGQIQTALAGAERIFAVLDEKSEDRSGETLPEKLTGSIEFRNVCFSYIPGKEVIHDFSLNVEQGKKIALVGATGSGKTTVINLLMRFYDIDSGEILIGGKNIKDISIDSLRSHVGIVLQDTVLFHDTVRNNLTYAKENISEDELKKAARISNADKVIRHLPKGYETVLAASGSDLSQGQRQLLAIGRAFVSDPDILILDEATSSVDTRTEKNIQDAMTELMKGRTSLIIAHRLSTIRDADRIIVMDHGEISEQGSHEELIRKKGKYWQLYMTQFAGQSI
ncbi:MAG: ABC transporter ATP-binding protein [Erysipelotrichaceae bacterium]|nr:ABC transporter ATP-binding protein [Erysipelotrichaceae bacterium]